jgi:putative transposase
MREEEKKKIAIFRFTVIGELVTSSLQPGEQERLLSEKARRKWQIPFSSRTHISKSTMLRWMRQYRRSGNKVESLYPDGRNDKGKARAIDNETAMNLVALRKQMPTAPVYALIEAADKRGLITPGTKLSQTTVYRFLHQRDLMGQVGDGQVDRRKFEAELPNDLWQSDVMHGPHVLCDGKLKKTYLIAFIDDHSRLVPYGAFFFSEGVGCYLKALEQAVLTRGLPRKLYVDNGSAFRSHHLESVAASLGFALIHATPYCPQGKGKIERFFRTVRSAFLSRAATDSLENLNNTFSSWLTEDYHQKKHSATGQTPFARFTARLECLRKAPDNILDHFRVCARRRVMKDRTVTLNRTLYEAPVALVGKNIELLYHPHDPQAVEAVFQQKSYGFLIPLDLGVNSRVKRDSGKLF